MSHYFDDLETRSPEEREADLFARLPSFLNQALQTSKGLQHHLKGYEGRALTSRQALAELPILRKADLMQRQAQYPPFGGFANLEALAGNRVFLSPGPIWEPQGLGVDPWQGARALFAAGFQKGDVVHNALAYHMTPGGFILDEACRALGCTVFPAGIGNTQMQIEAIAALKPSAYTGTPDYLKVILDKAVELGQDVSSIKRALVSGGALFPSLRAEYTDRGIDVLQAYATADLGVIAYESMHQGQVMDGMIVNENLIVEIVRPGTNQPVADGDVGELVVTNFSSAYPLVRFGTGDLSAVLIGQSPCGRTNMRLKGWMGRADQRTKIKGMFVDPKQIAELLHQHQEIANARLIVQRQKAQDIMLLQVKAVNDAAQLNETAIALSLREITKLGGIVEQVNTLPNDGKVIDDQRDYEG